MIELFQSSPYILLALLLVCAVAGYASGLFGIGGGVVTVPALMTLLPYWKTSPEVLMHLSVGTSLALILPGGSAATWKQYQLGNLDLSILKTWLPPVIFGVVLGGLVFSEIPSDSLKIFFLIYLICATIYAWYQKPLTGSHSRIPRVALQRMVGMAIGGISLLLGIGGGTFTVPFFKFCHYPMIRAIAISSATSLVLGIVGTAAVIVDGWGISGRAPYSLGFVNLPAFLVGTPTMLIFAPLGARQAHRFGEAVLKKIYVGFLALMAVYMFVKMAFLKF